MYRFIGAVLIFSLSITFSQAQINTEALRIEADRDGFKGTLNATGSLNAGNTSIYEFNLGGRVDYIFGRNRSFVVSNLTYGYKDEERFKNAAFIAFRNTWQWRPTLAIEGFVQQQMDEFIRLKDRKLLGGGVRLTAINTEKEESNLIFRTFIGVGGMGEREVFDSIDNDPGFETNLFRSTNYISLTFSYSELLFISAVQYFQFDVNNFDDHRYIIDLNMDIKVLEALSLLYRLSYRLDNKPPVDVRPFDLSSTIGFSYRF